MVWPQPHSDAASLLQRHPTLQLHTEVRAAARLRVLQGHDCAVLRQQTQHLDAIDEATWLRLYPN